MPSADDICVDGEAPALRRMRESIVLVLDTALAAGGSGSDGADLHIVVKVRVEDDERGVASHRIEGRAHCSAFRLEVIAQVHWHWRCARQELLENLVVVWTVNAATANDDNAVLRDRVDEGGLDAHPNPLALEEHVEVLLQVSSKSLARFLVSRELVRGPRHNCELRCINRQDAGVTASLDLLSASSKQQEKEDAPNTPT
jgi:hypothetical protein